MTDRIALISWLSVLLVIRGVVCIPITRVFGQFGLSFGLPLFFLIWTYIYWFGRNFFIVPPIFFSTYLCFVFSVLYFFVLQKAVPLCRKNRFSFDWVGEGVFWFSLLLFIWIRSYVPHLDQTEKFSDMAIFQAVLLDDSFPPYDRWLSGFSLNYYYFGHLLFVPITRALNIPAEWAVNLSVPTIHAMSVLTAYGLVRKLTNSIGFALLAAIMMTIFSNWEWTRQCWLSACSDSTFWWSSSRVLKNTITEFPYFSFLLGDFHAHFIALPWLSLCCFLWMDFVDRINNRISKSEYGIFSLLLSLSMGMHYPLNPWGFPCVLLTGAFLCRNHWKVFGLSGLLSVFLYIPFWIHYASPVSNVYWIPKTLRSSLLEFCLHWAVFLFPVILIMTLRVLSCKNVKFWLDYRKILLLTAVLVVWVIFGSVVGLIMILFLSFYFLVDSKTNYPEIVFFLVSGCFIIACEFLSLDATYGKDLLRMNTVFKFYMLAWWALALGVPVFLWRHNVFLRQYKYVPSLLLCVSFLMSLVYPVKALHSRIGSFDKQKTLDGMKYWDQVFPGEREAVNWIRFNTHSQDVIWEASGDPYSHYSRISTFSGRLSVLGWANHERVWRRDGYVLTKDRINDIEKLQLNPHRLDKFLHEYHIQWVVVGDLEKKSYSPDLLKKIQELPIAFSASSVTIYKGQVF